MDAGLSFNFIHANYVPLGFKISIGGIGAKELSDWRLFDSRGGFEGLLKI
jgi:hypothetical protein